jgi:hypothetical protein
MSSPIKQPLHAMSATGRHSGAPQSGLRRSGELLYVAFNFPVRDTIPPATVTHSSDHALSDIVPRSIAALPNPIRAARFRRAMRDQR